MTIDPKDETHAAVLDSKADFARKMEKHAKPSPTWGEVARMFDALADDTRLGVYHVGDNQ